MERCEGAILVYGNAYSGSTLLNVLLGSHPMIAGGGELHWLADGPEVERAISPRTEKDRLCTLCKSACPVWTQEVRASVTLDNIYDVTARLFNRPFVCDSTKTLDWAKVILPITKTPLTRILLVKHPLRHVASFVEKARRFAYMEKYSSIEFVLKSLINTINSANLHGYEMFIRYEDIVSCRRETINKIINPLGLEYDPIMEDWRILPQHYIGGNAGPRSQISPYIRPSYGFAMRKYDRQDIFMDNSFSHILTESEKDFICGHSLTKEFCDRFGYSTTIELSEPETDGSLSYDAARLSLETGVHLKGPFEPNGQHGFLYRIELLAEHVFLLENANTNEAPHRSPLMLFEDGQPLGPPHAVHQHIRMNAEGRFNHWNEALYFSASDGSNPNENGRRYEIRIGDA